MLSGIIDALCTKMRRNHERKKGRIEATEKGVKRALGKMTPAFFFMLLTLKRADNLAQNPLYSDRQAYYDQLEALAKEILARQDCFSMKDLAVNGCDLMAIGIPSGKTMGLILKRLLDEVINEQLPNEKDLLLQRKKVVLNRQRHVALNFIT